MTVHNQLSRLTEVQRGAKIAFGLDAGAGGLERLGETLQVVKDFWRDPADAAARGERLCQGSVTVAAGGAGNFSAAAFSVQQDGWLAHLHLVQVSLPTAMYVETRRGLPLPFTSNNRVFRDMRITGAPVGRISWVNNVAAAPAGTPCGVFRPLASSPLIMPVDWVIVNGGPSATETAFVIYGGTANQVIEVTFWWSERQLLPGELLR